MDLLFSIPFIFISFISLMLAIYLSWAKFRLNIDKFQITASYELCNFVYDEIKCNIKDIQEISEDIGYCNIEIIFKNSKKINFTTSNRSERRWLISKLLEIIKNINIQTVDIEENENYTRFIMKPYENTETTGIRLSDDTVKNHEKDKPFISKSSEIKETTDIQTNDTIAYRRSNRYELITQHVIMQNGVYLIFSFFLLLIIPRIIWTKEFNLNTLGEIAICAFFLILFVCELYDVIFHRPHEIIFGDDDKKLVFKSSLKIKTIFVKDIKSLEIRDRKDSRCILYTETDSIQFPVFEEFNEFVARLRKYNDWFTLDDYR